MADYVHSDGGAIAPELPPEPVAPGDDKGESLLRRHVSEFLKGPGAVAGLAVLVALVAIAVLAPAITPQNPYDLSRLDIMDNVLKPGEKLGSGITAFLGTDDQGRDMLSAIIYRPRRPLTPLARQRRRRARPPPGARRERVPPEYPHRGAEQTTGPPRPGT